MSWISTLGVLKMRHHMDTSIGECVRTVLLDLSRRYYGLRFEHSVLERQGKHLVPSCYGTAITLWTANQDDRWNPHMVARVDLADPHSLDKLVMVVEAFFGISPIPVPDDLQDEEIDQHLDEVADRMLDEEIQGLVDELTVMSPRSPSAESEARGPDRKGVDQLTDSSPPRGGTT